MQPLLLLLLLLTCSTVAGCVYEKNDRLTLGGAYRSPAIFDDPHLPTAANQEPRLFASKVTDRSAWSPTPVVAHFDGVVHGHMLRLFPAHRPNSPARLYGRFPSTSDALDPQAHGFTPDLWYTLREYGRSSLGSDYSFLYLLTRGELFEDMISPFPYKRTHEAGWSFGQPSKESSETTNE